LGSGVLASGITGPAFARFMAGYFCGATLWCLGVAALLGWGRRWVRPGLFRWINALVGVALGYFGIRLLWAAAQDLAQDVFGRRIPLAPSLRASR